LDRKLKKKLIVARNKRHNLINLQAAQHQENLERQAEEEAAILAALIKPAESSNQEVWSAKVQDIRNKLTGKKRMARDRWNRYSGTSDGGGMGR